MANAGATLCKFTDTECDPNRNVPADERDFTAQGSVSRSLVKPAQSIRVARIEALI